MNAIKYFLRKIWVRYRMVSLPQSYLHTTGFIRSHQALEPINAQGEPIPWMNYAMVEFLERRLQPQYRVFEYGSGFSTLYFKDKVREIVSLEYDEEWFRHLQKRLKDCKNVKLRYEPVGPDYVGAAPQSGQAYDLIIVDGRERSACVKAGLQALTPGGVLLLDDSDREEYQGGFAEAKKAGFRALTISGIKPFSFTREESTLFYRDHNVLKI